MKNFKVKGMKPISKSDQKSISGGGNWSIYIMCMNECNETKPFGPERWRCWEICAKWL